MSLGSSDRLLLALYPENSYAFTSDAGDDLRAVAPRRGVSVESGRFTLEAGAALVAAGFAHWQAAGPSRRARLMLNEAGRARAALVHGVHGIEPVRALKGHLQGHSKNHAQAHVNAPVKDDGSMLVDEAQSPLSWLARRRGRDGKPLLAPELFQAGERLRREFELARTLPALGTRWDGLVHERSYQPQNMPLLAQRLAARQRIDQALEAVGPEFADVLIDICADQKGLEWIEEQRCWPRRSARIVLDLALSRLARHYGLFVSSRRTHLRVWHAPEDETVT